MKYMNYNKIVLFIACLLSVAGTVSAQKSRVLHMEEHDSKPYYFGLAFAMNTSAFKIGHPANFGYTDTFKNVQAKWGPGFNVGLMGSLRLNSFIDARFIPSIVFSTKPIHTVDAREELTRNIESIYMHLPLQLKFKSDRIGNFRFFGIAGGKFDYDLASNARSRRTDEFLKVKPFDVGIELGVGFDFFFANFILSPEVKVSQGLMNSHFHDSDLKLSNDIESLKTRMFVISLNIQG